MRCRATGCSLRTKYGYYCITHADELLGVQVHPSLIHGLGLFSTRHFHRHEIIEPYDGTRTNVVTNTDYAIDVPNTEIIINASRPTDCFTRFLNDGRSEAKNNCQFITEKDYGSLLCKPRYKTGSKEVIVVMTSREIEPNEELLVPYGLGYWWARS